MFLNTTTHEYPLSEAHIKQKFTQISFSTKFVPPEPYVLVERVDPPVYDAVLQELKEGPPVFNHETQTWLQQWLLTDRSPEYIEAVALNRRQALKDSITLSAQQRLDNFARSRGYDSVNSIAKYKDISDQEISSLPVDQQPLVTKFRSECRYLALAAASTWAQLYVILGQVEAGTTAMPAGFQDIEPLLPPLSWPV